MHLHYFFPLIYIFSFPGIVINSHNHIIETRTLYFRFKERGATNPIKELVAKIK